MEADILPMQYEVLNVFIWDKNSHGQCFCNIKVKWTCHNTSNLFLWNCFNIVCGYLSYACREEFVNRSWKKKIITENLTQLLVKQNENFFQKVNLIDSRTFSFEIPNGISLQCSENKYHFTESNRLANTSSSI